MNAIALLAMVIDHMLAELREIDLIMVSRGTSYHRTTACMMWIFPYRQLRYRIEPRIEMGVSLWILMDSDEDRSTGGMVNSMMTCGLDMKLGLLSHEAFAVGTSSLSFG